MLGVPSAGNFFQRPPRPQALVWGVGVSARPVEFSQVRGAASEDPVRAGRDQRGGPFGVGVRWELAGMSGLSPLQV